MHCIKRFISSYLAIKHIDLFKDMELSSNIELTIIDGADHHFSGEHLATFISLPNTAFFK